MRISTPDRLLVRIMYPRGNHISGPRPPRLTFWQVFLVNVNTSASPGSVVLDNQTTGPSIYATTGGSRNFLQYFVSNNTWVSRAITPANVGAGGGARYIGLGNISTIRGGNSNAFWIYNISSNSWSVKAVTPSTCEHGRNIIRLYRAWQYFCTQRCQYHHILDIQHLLKFLVNKGKCSRQCRCRGSVGIYRVWQYLCASEVPVQPLSGFTTFPQISWSVKANAPGNVGAGGAIAYDNGNYIYAFNGTNTRNFWRYNISGNSWSSLANIPGNVGAGGSLVSDKGNYIYAFNGYFETVFLEIRHFQ